MRIDWNKIAKEIYDNLKEKVSKLDIKPTLWVILVWENSPSLRYIKQKKKFSEYIWINFILKTLKIDVTQEKLLEIIHNFNNDKNISWFMIQFPLPDHIDKIEIINAISPKKDVDWFTTINTWKICISDNSWLASCTPAWIMYILKYLNIDLVWKNITVIGRSNIVWKPITNMLMNSWATVVNCNSKTKNLHFFTKKSDIIISAAWKPGLITENMLKKNAVIIDVWFSVIDGKIYWDCDIKDDSNYKITPVPGWVWPLTVAMLMKNTIKAYNENNSLKGAPFKKGR